MGLHSMQGQFLCGRDYQAELRGGMEPEGDCCPGQKVMEVKSRRVQRHLQLERCVCVQRACSDLDSYRQRAGHRVTVFRKHVKEEKMLDVLMITSFEASYADVLDDILGVLQLYQSLQPLFLQVQY